MVINELKRRSVRSTGKPRRTHTPAPPRALIQFVALVWVSRCHAALSLSLISFSHQSAIGRELFRVK